ncbi:hypothetical protein EUA98_16685 [Pengzhenrongella frigida]|uniref:Uncharacterized protein n=1 Tax=Pengzhenrongella frigida TaxID=1259133 RepID=A0A4Q5MW80_9MICO|nr:hypothetical protein EUA98_16685 [Cellulomonas sp. HLT2-17]
MVLAVACLLVLLQAAVLVGLAIAWITDLVSGASQVPGATVFLVLFALGIAAILLTAARALYRGRRWARSPVITWQILLIAMSVGWLGAEPTGWAVAVLASALLVGVALLVPSVVAATSDRGHRPDDGGSPAT